jgi:hypothetical protein
LLATSSIRTLWAGKTMAFVPSGYLETNIEAPDDTLPTEAQATYTIRSLNELPLLVGGPSINRAAASSFNARAAGRVKL